MTLPDLLALGLLLLLAILVYAARISLHASRAAKAAAEARLELHGLKEELRIANRIAAESRDALTGESQSGKVAK